MEVRRILHKEFVDGFLDKWFCSFVIKAHEEGVVIKTILKTFSLSWHEIKKFQTDILPDWAAFRLRWFGSKIVALKIVHSRQDMPSLILFFSCDNSKWFKIFEDKNILVEDTHNYKNIKTSWRKMLRFAAFLFIGLFLLAVIGIIFLIAKG